MTKKTSELVPPGLSYIADNIINKRNILGAGKAEGAKWAKDLNLPTRAETVFFAGCGYQFSHDLESMMDLIRKMDKSVVGSELPMRLAGLQKKVDVAGLYRKMTSRGSEEAGPLRDAVKVLQKLGLNPGYLAEDEPCCGAPLHFFGREQDFAKNAAETYKKLKSLGVKRLICIVPSCTNALKNLFPQVVPGYDIEVKHFVEVVAENVLTLKLAFPKPVKATYHDPCQLGRYMLLYDAPRTVLKSIKNLEFVEPDWTKGEWSTCCGGGGGFEAVFPELSQVLACNRAKELAETGAQIIVTHCPGCVMQLKVGLQEIKSDAEVLDLAQVVAMSLEV